MTNFAIAVLDQLKRTAKVFDGNLVSKTGRDELMQAGLAQRNRKFKRGPYHGCHINELTKAGQMLAMHLVTPKTSTRN